VSDFVRRDRDFTGSEFRRRMEDLDDVQRDLQRLSDQHRRHSYVGYCDLCGGPCRDRR
jgi:hypothetical protein